MQALKFGFISARAATLLAFLLNRRQPGDWAWASNAFLARELGCSVDSIMRAAKELSAAKLTFRHQVPSPDPDARANRTGWRWEFAFLTGKPSPPPRPAKASKPATVPRPASLQGSQPSVVAGVASCVVAGVAESPPNQDSREKEKIDRTSDLPTQGRQETPDETIMGLAVAQAEAANQAAFAAALERETPRHAAKAAAHPDACMKAVEATISRIDGTAKAKPIANPMGYFVRTFADMIANGPTAGAVYTPKAKAEPIKTRSETKPAEPPAIPLSAAELADLIAEAGRPGTSGKIARGTIARGLRLGEIPPEAIPSDLRPSP